MRDGAVLAFAACCTLLVAGCASVVSGSTQKVRVLSEPPDAMLSVGDRSTTTPAVMDLSRDRDYEIVIRKPGYVTARRKVLRHANPWIAGNVLSFGGVGMEIDRMTGAAYQFPEPTLFVALIRQPVDAADAVVPDPGRFGHKIHLDLTAFDDAGLTGSADSRRAGAYELCIPALAEEEAVVTAIDPTVALHRRSRGRIGCAVPDEVLCVGSTHQPDFRAVLQRLAALPYVTRIAPFVGE